MRATLFAAQRTRPKAITQCWGSVLSGGAQAYSELSKVRVVKVFELDSARLALSADGTVEVAEEATQTVSLSLGTTPLSAVRIPLPEGDRVALSCVSQVRQAAAQLSHPAIPVVAAGAYRATCH